ncbi:hypothetical protein M011DRAFT_472461, partial [Sporormia fimetaria CBS 119925]
MTRHFRPLTHLIHRPHRPGCPALHGLGIAQWSKSPLFPSSPLPHTSTTPQPAHHHPPSSNTTMPPLLHHLVTALTNTLAAYLDVAPPVLPDLRRCHYLNHTQEAHERARAATITALTVSIKFATTSSANSPDAQGAYTEEVNGEKMLLYLDTDPVDPLLTFPLRSFMVFHKKDVEFLHTILGHDLAIQLFQLLGWGAENPGSEVQTKVFDADTTIQPDMSRTLGPKHRHPATAGNTATCTTVSMPCEGWKPKQTAFDDPSAVVTPFSIAPELVLHLPTKRMYVRQTDGRVYEVLERREEEEGEGEWLVVERVD